MGPSRLEETVKEITASEYSGVIDSGDCLVVFTKKVCPFCKTMKKVMEKFAAGKGDVGLFDINSETEEGMALMMKIEVERVPTMLLYKGGNEVRRITGVLNAKELARAWQEAG